MQFFRSLGRGQILLLCLILGIFAGTGLFTFSTARGLSYLSNNPKTCVNCHIMREQFDAWQKSSHHAVATCNDCHVPHDFFGKWFTKAENGWNHSKGFTLQDFHEPIMLKPASERVLQNNCLFCHEKFVSEITGHATLGDDPVNCVRCHNNVGHGAHR